MKQILYNISNDTPIYRYINFHQLVAFIEKEKTYLSKVSIWDDPYEDILKELPVKHSGYKFGDFRGTGDYYAQSWSLDGNSDAMWRIYSQDKKGILLKTTVNKLKNIQGIKTALVGKVIYYKDLKEAVRNLFNDEPNDIQATTLKYPLLKRASFSHEQEIRLITVYHEDYLDIKKYEEFDFIEMELIPKNFIDEIIIDPRSPEWFVKTVETYIANKDIELTPRKSELYNFDKENLKGMEIEFN